MPPRLLMSAPFLAFLDHHRVVLVDGAVVTDGFPPGTQNRTRAALRLVSHRFALTKNKNNTDSVGFSRMVSNCLAVSDSVNGFGSGVSFIKSEDVSALSKAATTRVGGTEKNL